MKCEVCERRYRDGGDGFAGLCPPCADLTDIPELERFLEDERRELLRAARHEAKRPNRPTESVRATLKRLAAEKSAAMRLGRGAGFTIDQGPATVGASEIQRATTTSDGPPPAREAAVGRVAICRIGYLGLIEGRATLPWGEAWVGRGLVTGAPWSSRKPIVLSEQDEAAVLAAFGAGIAPDVLSPTTAATGA